jgi:hypothetical protein
MIIPLCLVVLGGLLPVAPAAAQETSESPTLYAARLDTSFTVPGSNNTKYPSVAGVGDQVHVALSSASSGTSNDRTIRVASKPDTSNTFTTFNAAGARGQADYTNHAVTANRFDNSVHIAWINQDDSTIRYRRRDANGTWGETRTVIAGRADTGSSFRVFVDIAVASDGRIFVAWSQDAFARYRTSTDNGASWSNTRRVSLGNEEIITRPKVAAGANGVAVLTYSTAEGGNIVAGIWDGSDFRVEVAANSGRDYFTNPWGAIGPTGTIFIAWREGAQGVYFTERQANGSWPVSRIARGPIVDTVPISVDPQGNVSISWVSTASGGSELFYAFRPVGRNFETFVQLSGAGALFNAAGATTLSNRGYMHVAVETFRSSGLETLYVRFSADASNCQGGTVTLNNNGVFSSPTITGSITPPANCQADRRQVSLNTQDTNAAVESLSPNTFSLTVPQDQLTRCTHTVNARLLQGTSPFSWFSATARVDPPNVADPVQARVELLNPYLTSEISRTPTPSDTLDDGGARDGDRRFTRTLQGHLRVLDAGDCSGIGRFTWTGNGALANVIVPSSGYSETVALPQLPANTPPGRKDYSIVVSDGAGNQETNPVTLIYDPANPENAPGAGRPVLAAGASASADNSAAARLQIIRTLTITGTRVTDNLYNAANGVNVPANGQFWGLWVATEYLGSSTTPPPANPESTTLRYIPIRPDSVSCTDAAGCTVAAQINLFSGQRNQDGTPFGPDTTKSGTYRVYVRFLDGAGNYTTASLTTSFTLDQGYQLPGVLLGTILR